MTHLAAKIAQNLIEHRKCRLRDHPPESALLLSKHEIFVVVSFIIYANYSKIRSITYKSSFLLT